LEDKNKKVVEDLKRCEKIKKESDALAYINPEIAEENNNKAKELF